MVRDLELIHRRVPKVRTGNRGNTLLIKRGGQSRIPPEQAAARLSKVKRTLRKEALLSMGRDVQQLARINCRKPGFATSGKLLLWMRPVA